VAVPNGGAQVSQRHVEVVDVHRGQAQRAFRDAGGGVVAGRPGRGEDGRAESGGAARIRIREPQRLPSLGKGGFSHF
jgi:hypothetical protein